MMLRLSYGQVWRSPQDEDDRFMLVCPDKGDDWWLAVELSNWPKHSVGDLVRIAAEDLDGESYEEISDAPHA